MDRARAPWWMYLLAAAFLLHYAFFTYVVTAGPAALGIQPGYRDGRMVLRGVTPGSAAAQAGLQRGDVVLSVAGINLRGYGDWLLARGQVNLHEPVEVVYERDGARQTARVVQPQRKWSTVSASDKIVGLSIRGVLLGYLLLGIFVAFRRPRDTQALIGALFICSLAGAPGTISTGLFASLRALPWPLAVLVWVALIANGFVAVLLFSFFAVFPRRLFTARWPWFVAWAPAIAWAAVLVRYDLLMTYAPQRLRDGTPRYLLPGVFAVFFVYIVAGLAALLINYRRLEQVNDRRRLRLLVYSAIPTWVFILPLALLSNLNPTGILGAILNNILADIAMNGLLLLFPVTFAYVILRHRVFDLGIVVRQGLQYAAARNGILALVPILGAALVLDVALHRRQPVGDLLAARGWVYVVLGGLAFAAHARRRHWLDTLDRRYFRERYDANRLLREVVEDIRRSTSCESAAPAVVAKIETALHPEFVAHLARVASETWFRVLAVAPAGVAPPRLPSDHKVVALLRVFGKPLALAAGDSGWLREQLPASDSDFLRQARIDLLVPIVLGEAGSESLLVLGPRRSEEPYSGEDKDLLSSIAASLALLLEHPAGAAVPAGTFQECSACGECCDSHAPRCPRDGSQLTPVPLPRLLAGRFYLDRRIGRGGMGSVYAAVDSELQRRVAVKLIREELVGNPDAAERFRREARAAAIFAHPNVVTVHDFGVAAGKRAFLVMELLDGESLREELRRQGRLDASHLVAILRAIAGALDAAHRQGLVHRDLKPENIFLARVGGMEVPKVLDFGLAKFLPASDEATMDTAAGVVVGTPRYMAPEQLRAGLPAPAWDVWALAVTAYEALAGEHPFGSGSPAECQKRILDGEFAPLSPALAGNFPPLPSFFAAALSVTPARRPASATDFVAQLESALALPRTAAAL